MLGEAVISKHLHKDILFNNEHTKVNTYAASTYASSYPPADFEQLRILWQGARIQMSIVSQPIIKGVDTPEDLLMAQQLEKIIY